MLIELKIVSKKPANVLTNHKAATVPIKNLFKSMKLSRIRCLCVDL